MFFLSILTVLVIFIIFFFMLVYIGYYLYYSGLKYIKYMVILLFTGLSIISFLIFILIKMDNYSIKNSYEDFSTRYSGYEQLNDIQVTVTNNSKLIEEDYKVYSIEESYKKRKRFTKVDTYYLVLKGENNYFIADAKSLLNTKQYNMDNKKINAKISGKNIEVNLNNESYLLSEDNFVDNVEKNIDTNKKLNVNELFKSANIPTKTNNYKNLEEVNMNYTDNILYNILNDNSSSDDKTLYFGSDFYYKNLKDVDKLKDLIKDYYEKGIIPDIKVTDTINFE